MTILLPFWYIQAGAISSAIATPTDVLKVRMQVHGRGTDQIGLIGCFREIYQYEGISGLWKVSYHILNWRFELIIPMFLFISRDSVQLHKEVRKSYKSNVKYDNIFCLILAAVIAAVELPVYDFCKLHLLDTFGDHVANHFM